MYNYEATHTLSVQISPSELTRIFFFFYFSEFQAGANRNLACLTLRFMTGNVRQEMGVEVYCLQPKASARN